MRLYIAAFLYFVIGSSLLAQVVYTEPEFPSQFDDVTIYFDATQGNA